MNALLYYLARFSKHLEEFMAIRFMNSPLSSLYHGLKHVEGFTGKTLFAFGSFFLANTSWQAYSQADSQGLWKGFWNDKSVKDQTSGWMGWMTYPCRSLSEIAPSVDPRYIAIAMTTLGGWMALSSQQYFKERDVLQNHQQYGKITVAMNALSVAIDNLDARHHKLTRITTAFANFTAQLSSFGQVMKQAAKTPEGTDKK